MAVEQRQNTGGHRRRSEPCPLPAPLTPGQQPSSPPATQRSIGASVEAIVCAACPAEHHAEVAELCRRHKVMKAFGFGSGETVGQWQSRVLMAVVGLVEEREASVARIICIEGDQPKEHTAAQKMVEPFLVQAVRAALSNTAFDIRMQWMFIDEYRAEFAGDAVLSPLPPKSGSKNATSEQFRGPRPGSNGPKKDRTPGSAQRQRDDSLVVAWECVECKAVFEKYEELVDHQQTEGHWDPTMHTCGRTFVSESEFKARRSSAAADSPSANGEDSVLGVALGEIKAIDMASADSPRSLKELDSLSPASVLNKLPKGFVEGSAADSAVPESAPHSTVQRTGKHTPKASPKSSSFRQPRRPARGDSTNDQSFGFQVPGDAGSPSMRGRRTRRDPSKQQQQHPAEQIGPPLPAGCHQNLRPADSHGGKGAGSPAMQYRQLQGGRAMQPANFDYASARQQRSIQQHQGEHQLDQQQYAGQTRQQPNMLSQRSIEGQANQCGQISGGYPMLATNPSSGQARLQRQIDNNCAQQAYAGHLGLQQPCPGPSSQSGPCQAACGMPTQAMQSMASFGGHARQQQLAESRGAQQCMSGRVGLQPTMASSPRMFGQGGEQPGRFMQVGECGQQNASLLQGMPGTNGESMQQGCQPMQCPPSQDAYAMQMQFMPYVGGPSRQQNPMDSNAPQCPLGQNGRQQSSVPMQGMMVQIGENGQPKLVPAQGMIQQVGENGQLSAPTWQGMVVQAGENELPLQGMAVQGGESVGNQRCQSMQSMPSHNACAMQSMPLGGGESVGNQRCQSMQSMPSHNACAMQSMPFDGGESVSNQPCQSMQSMPPHNACAMQSMPFDGGSSVSNQRCQSMQSMPSHSACAMQSMPFGSGHIAPQLSGGDSLAQQSSFDQAGGQPNMLAVQGMAMQVAENGPMNAMPLRGPVGPVAEQVGDRGCQSIQHVPSRDQCMMQGRPLDGMQMCQQHLGGSSCVQQGPAGMNGRPPMGLPLHRLDDQDVDMMMDQGCPPMQSAQFQGGCSPQAMNVPSGPCMWRPEMQQNGLPSHQPASGRGYATNVCPAPVQQDPSFSSNWSPCGNAGGQVTMVPNEQANHQPIKHGGYIQCGGAEDVQRDQQFAPIWDSCGIAEGPPHWALNGPVEKQLAATGGCLGGLKGIWRGSPANGKAFRKGG